MKDRMHLSIRFDNDIHDKIQYIAKYEGENIVNLNTDLSSLELSLAEIIYRGVKE